MRNKNDTTRRREEKGNKENRKNVDNDKWKNIISYTSENVYS